MQKLMKESSLVILQVHAYRVYNKRVMIFEESILVVFVMKDYLVFF